MAAPVRRPQFLLPWIAVCTVVLGVGLQTLAPERSRRGGTGAAAARMPEALIAPLPARLEPLARSFLVQNYASEAGALQHDAPQDPSRPNQDLPAEAPASGAAAAGSALAGRERQTPDGEAAQSAARVEPAPANGGIERPGLRRPAATESAAALVRSLPTPGASLRWRWNGHLSGAAGEPEPSEPALAGPELVILRVSEAAYQAFLILDDAGTPDANSEDPVAPDAPPDSGRHHEEGSSASGEGHYSDPRPAPRERWQRWFAEQAPRRARAAAPQSREELRVLLERTLGEHKVRYLVAASRELDAREAAELLGRVRRWMLDQRAG